MLLATGVYNEAAWRSIDYILATAAKYRVKVIYTVANNWINTDGPATVSCCFKPICHGGSTYV